MKKIFLIPIATIMLLSSGVTSQRTEPVKPISPVVVPLNTSIDSLTIKAAELDILIHKL